LTGFFADAQNDSKRKEALGVTCYLTLSTLSNFPYQWEGCKALWFYGLTGFFADAQNDERNADALWLRIVFNRGMMLEINGERL